MENRNAIGWWKKVVLENYANFEGRARRSEYWYFQLVTFGIILLGYVLVFIGAATEIGLISGLGGAIAGITGLALLVPSIAVAVRRMHDLGKSGWFICIYFIPFVGPFIMLYFLVQDSQPGANEYGPNPKTGGDFDIDKIGG